MSGSSAPSTPPRRPAKRDTLSMSAAPSPLRIRDPAIERTLQLSTFEDRYSTEDFVGSLSEKLIAESKADPGPYNPTPFMRTFSPALDALLALRQQVAERTKRMETEVRRSEREYGRRLRELDSGFEAIGSSFTSLEGKITDVGRTAVRIGEQLESLHQTRSTAQSVALLLSYYLSLVHQTSTTPDPSQPSSTPLEALFATRSSRDGRARLAVILRRLMAVAKDVADNAAAALAEAEAAATPRVGNGEGGSSAADGGGGGGELGAQERKAVSRRRVEKERAERVRDEIEKYCERFEKEVLRLFDRSYRKGDPRMMAHCAKTLQDFNGGQSCVQIYVNQHDFFISKDRVLEDAEKAEAEGRIDIWKSVGDPDANPPASEPGLDALFKDIRETVSQEVQIVKAVFPNPTAVMEVFLQRVFAQVIQQHIESLVARAAAISTLAVLRILNLTHAACSSLVDDLKAYDATLSGYAPVVLTRGPTSIGVGGGGSAEGGAGTGPLAAMLDHALEDMYSQWIEGARYLESESKNLVELYGGLLSRYTRYHETVLKAKPNSLLDRVVNQLSTSSSSTASTASTAASAISKYANLFTSTATSATKSLSATGSPALSGRPAGPSVSPANPAVARLGERPSLSRSNSVNRDLRAIGPNGQEEKLYASDGVVTVQMAERMLRWHAEAVGRIVELSATGDVGKNAFALSKVLAEAIGRSFVETALDSALARLDQQDARAAAPDLALLTVLKPVDLISHLWQRYTATALVPLAGAAAAVRREMATFNSHNVVRIEGKVNTVVQRALDAIFAYLASALTRQKRNDFKPKNDELSFARTNTEPCELATEFLGHVREVAVEALGGKNQEAFLTEVGVGFHSMLLDHFKKFPVNPTGGLMLTKDLASYQEAAGAFGLAAVNDRFDMLRQLGNSFIVQPNVLKSYLTESHLGRIDPRLLRPYLQQRSDWSTFAKQLQLDDAHDDAAGAGGAAGSGGGGGSASAPATTTSPSLGSFGAGTMSASPSMSNLSGLTGLGLKRGGAAAGARLSVMSGVAGAGMARLREALKEFEALGPEHADAAPSERAVVRPQQRPGLPMSYMVLH
ncbi:Exocyst complex component 5 [Cryptotrichosporon argae]